MNVQTEELPGCRTNIVLSFDADEVTASFNTVYNDLNKRGQVRGFRPGKVPKTLLVRHYGAEAIQASAWYELVGDHLREALDALDMIGEPELPKPEESGITEGEPFEFTLETTVGPRVKLGETTGMELVRPSPIATEESIGATINDLRDSHAEETQPDRDVVKPGDAVDLELTITLEGDDEPVDEVEETLIVGAGQHFPPVDEKLPGRIVGQSVEMDVTYPDDYYDESLAGASGHITAKVLAVRERILPEFNDEFASKVDETFGTADELRAEIKRQLDEQCASYAREELEAQITKTLFERSEVELPEKLVESVAGAEAESLAEDLREAGLETEELHDLAGLSEEEFEERQLERARRLLTGHAILKELVKERAEEASSEEIEAEAERYAEDRGLDLRLTRQAAQVQVEFLGELKLRVERRKAFDSVLEAAQLSDMPVEEYREQRDELMKPAEPEETEQQPDDEAADAGDEGEPSVSQAAVEDASEEDVPEAEGADGEDSTEDVSETEEASADAEDNGAEEADEQGEGDGQGEAEI